MPWLQALVRTATRARTAARFIHSPEGTMVGRFILCQGIVSRLPHHTHARAMRPLEHFVHASHRSLVTMTASPA